MYIASFTLPQNCSQHVQPHTVLYENILLKLASSDSQVKVFEEQICSETVGYTTTIFVNLCGSPLVCGNASSDYCPSQGLINIVDKDGEETQKEIIKPQVVRSEGL